MRTQNTGAQACHPGAGKVKRGGSRKTASTTLTSFFRGRSLSRVLSTVVPVVGRALPWLAVPVGVGVGAGLVHRAILPVAGGLGGLLSVPCNIAMMTVSAMALPVSVGLLAAPFVAPVAGSLIKAVRRLVLRNVQEAVVREAGEVYWQDLRSTAFRLDKAGYSMKKEGRRLLEACGEPFLGGDAPGRYLLAFLSPAMLVPPLAVLAGVSLPAAVPLALGMGVMACATRLVTHAVDRHLDGCLGEHFMDRGDLARGTAKRLWDEDSARAAQEAGESAVS